MQEGEPLRAVIKNVQRLRIAVMVSNIHDNVDTQSAVGGNGLIEGGVKAFDGFFFFRVLTAGPQTNARDMARTEHRHLGINTHVDP
jgi:hypothetical protein